MRKIRKVFCAISALLLLITYDSCGTEGIFSEKSDAPIVLNVFSQVANYSGKQVGWFADEMLERFNVIINIVPDVAGTYETRMASENLGDIVVFGTNGDDYKNAVNAGLLLDWEKDNLLSESGAYIKNNMKIALSCNRSLVEGSDRIYGFANDVASEPGGFSDFIYTWDIRYDLYEKLGSPEVNDLDDLYDVFAGMKQLEPMDEKGNPTYALSMWPDWDGSMMMYTKALASAYYGMEEVGLGLYDPETGEFVGALEENGPYIEMLRFLNRLYRSDLIDPDSMTQTYVEMSEKMINGGCFFSVFDYAGSDQYNTAEHIANNRIMLPLVPKEARPVTQELSVFGQHQIWSIGSKTRYPELCMEIINWLATPEGCMTVLYGKKGVNWDYDESGYPYLTERGYLCTTDGTNEATKDTNGYTFNAGRCQINNTTWAVDSVNPDSNGVTYNYENWDASGKEPRCEAEEHWRERTGATTVTEYITSGDHVICPASTYSETSKTEEFDVICTQVSQCIVSYSWNAIYSETEEEFARNISEMTEKCIAYGYKTCIDWSKRNASNRRRHELEDYVLYSR